MNKNMNSIRKVTQARVGLRHMQSGSKITELLVGVPVFETRIPLWRPIVMKT